MSAEERKFIFDVINFLWQQTRSIFFTRAHKVDRK